MDLSQILKETGTHSVSGNLKTEITGLTEDSRQVERGFLFFARKGMKATGLNFVKDAIAKGAAAVASDESLKDLPVPFVHVRSIAQAQISISESFYHSPSKQLTVVGVTGTNGKTTFTFLLETIAQMQGWKTGVIGTINYRLPKSGGETEIFPAPNTTPNILELQKNFSALVERKADLVLMEVSSHALALRRVEPVRFHGAVFTNLTQDHLDFHKTMEEYFKAKAMLFKQVSPSGFSVINADDPHGARMKDFSSAKVTTYGMENNSDLTATQVKLKETGSQFTLKGLGFDRSVRLALPGKHNIYNALAAAASAALLKIPANKIVKGLEKITLVPGRLEPVRCGQPFVVFVDYAHTEDALKNVLEALRPLTKGKVLTLFGCGGDRDRSKRPLMGTLAVRMSDYVVVTSDNPRSEDPQKITLDIEVGIHRTGLKNYEVILDREKAIERILQMAQKDDIVLLAGKGHENYQIFNDKTIHFDDREAARMILSKHH